ncbi:stabilin-1 isoform X1 [Paramuricea clavata]|uniref:Stabilin-1 isoform X1 n=1 Tax=Paramuricea clavata TaxID=317549 RepID=A0A6S7HCX8_PARCT|nr:stabilin-1 isoform X1 [Paramuricea clavata]
MSAPGVKECQCKSGYVGNGTYCYGNIVQRIDDLHGYGQNKDKFIHVKNIIKKHPDLTFAFTDRGPFTIFLPTDKGLESKFNKSQLSYIISDKQMVRDLILVHSASAFLPTSVLNDDGRLTTLKGWDAAVTSNGGMFYQLSGHAPKPSITRSDIMAWNGILHVIDEPVWIPDFTNITKTSSKTLWQVIDERSELRTFRDFIQLADMQSQLQTTTDDLTLVAPVNEAFVNFDKNDTEFLRTPKGKAKLQAILRHHIFRIKIGIIDLSYKSSIMSLAAELVNVNVTDKGALLLGKKSKLIDNNIPAVNGYLHLTDNLLVPSFVLPIVQRHCDNNTKIVNSPCRPCRLTYTNGNCPQGTVTTNKRQYCLYRINYVIGSKVFTGCKSLCVPAIKKCCKGFYGSDCSSCPGPVGNPCFGNGNCLDGEKGSGNCKCFNGFRGTACELCKDGKFGLDCKKSCRCLHGTCDSGRFGNGSCVPSTCVAGFYGENCAISVRPCAGDPRVKAACHIHANCYLNNSQPICICNTGYEEILQNCYEIDPCLKAGRGGCDKNAICTKTAPGRSTCTCSVGWTGDGTYCTPINYCAMPSRGGCHRNAKCTFLGPAQVKCECNAGYEGGGTSCREINTCLRNNGNCSPLARCIKTGPGKNKCICRVGYLGDGVTCQGSLSVVAQRQNELSIISSLMVKYNLVRYLADPKRNVTVFVPSNAAISKLDPARRKLLDVPINLYFLGGSNAVPGLYTSSSLRDETIKRLPSLFKNVYMTINHTDSGEPLIGGIANITTANITASNGILHIVDKVLFPAFVRTPRTEPTVYEGLCGHNTTFTEMCNFIQKFNLQEEMKSCNHCSIFVPTDEAFHKLSQAQYQNISRKGILFHMTNHFIAPRTILEGQQFASRAGQFYMLYFQKNDKGELTVNGVLPTYYKSNSTWIIYKIPTVLQAIGNTCYEKWRIVLKGRPEGSREQLGQFATGPPKSSG